MPSSETIKYFLDNSEFGYVPEYQFDKHFSKKKFRADFAILKYAILIEFEGLTNNRRISRHQTVKGYSVDCDKYNIATNLGFWVLRYTQLNCSLDKVESDVRTLVKRIEFDIDSENNCCNCKEILYTSKKLYIKTKNGFQCLVCQWIQDDRKKK